MAYTKLYTMQGMKRVNMTDLDVKKILDLPDEVLFEFMKENRPNHYENLSYNEYLYLCSVYEFNIKSLKEKYKDKQKMLREKLKFIEIESTMIDNNNKVFDKLFLKPKKQRNYRSSFKLSEDIIDEMNKNMDYNYDKDERMLYYYFKMLNMFQTDTTFNFIRMVDFTAASRYVKNFNNLYNITLENNETTCFEFVEILKYFAKHENFLVSNNNIDNYGTASHVTLEVYTGSTYFSFDSLSKNKPYDMISVKKKEGYSGIKYLSKDPNIEEKINRVYKDVIKEYKKPHIKKYSNRAISKIINTINQTNLDEIIKLRFSHLISEINNINLNGIEYYSEVLQIILKFIKETNNTNILPVIVCSKKGKVYGFNLIIRINSKDSNYYIRLGDNDLVEILSKEKLEEYIRSNKIIPCIHRTIKDGRMKISYSFIPGIDEDFQKEMNKNAKNTIVPKILDEQIKIKSNIMDDRSVKK